MVAGSTVSLFATLIGELDNLLPVVEARAAAAAASASRSALSTPAVSRRPSIAINEHVTDFEPPKSAHEPCLPNTAADDDDNNDVDSVVDQSHVISGSDDDEDERRRQSVISAPPVIVINDPPEDDSDADVASGQDLNDMRLTSSLKHSVVGSGRGSGTMVLPASPACVCLSVDDTRKRPLSIVSTASSSSSTSSTSSLPRRYRKKKSLPSDIETSIADGTMSRPPLPPVSSSSLSGTVTAVVDDDVDDAVMAGTTSRPQSPTSSSSPVSTQRLVVDGGSCDDGEVVRRVVEELVETERSYVQDIGEIVDVSTAWCELQLVS